MALERALRACPPGATPADWFDVMADAALRQSCLVVGSSRWRLLEVEFYLYTPEHPDPCVHRSPQQLETCGAWYFHRAKAASLSYTLKGLDLTFGPPGTAGGMLIRAMECEHGAGPKGQYVEGPSKVVDVVLRAAGVERVAELVLPASAFAAEGPLWLEPAEPNRAVVRRGPRFGLKKPDRYQMAPYRYRAKVSLTKKDKKGVQAGSELPLPAPPGPPPPDAPGGAVPDLLDWLSDCGLVSADGVPSGGDEAKAAPPGDLLPDAEPWRTLLSFARPGSGATLAAFAALCDQHRLRVELVFCGEGELSATVHAPGGTAVVLIKNRAIGRVRFTA